jgi:hypothetical protein
VDVNPEPDTKDWTWVLDERCPECGFDTSAPARSALAGLTDVIGQRWAEAMTMAAAPSQRPAPAVWSPAEYACHVRDLFDLASYRVGLMRAEEAPAFANWDQDVTAIEDDYASQDAQVVTGELFEAAHRFAEVVGAVPADAWTRTGLRSDGATFTIESFVRYVLHDAVHHLTDVTGERWT